MKFNIIVGFRSVLFERAQKVQFCRLMRGKIVYDDRASKFFTHNAPDFLSRKKVINVFSLTEI